MPEQRLERLSGGRVLVDGRFLDADLVLDGDRIAGIDADRPAGVAERPEDAADSVLDAAGMLIAPGFIDLQCNGAGGVDLTTTVADDAEAINRVAEVLPRFGVTSFLPTVVTSPRSVREAALTALRSVPVPHDAATPLGLHFEGPMISRSHLGAHRRSDVATLTAGEVGAWQADDVALVTLAPELDGATPIIQALTANGIVASAGHTAAGPAEFAAARSAGLRYVTHLFNAMAPFSHRDPGPVGAALADPDVVVGLICDGLHVDPVAVAMVWRVLGPSRTSLVSDASAPLGSPTGTYRLGDADITYDETGVRTAGGVLAGSALELDRAVRLLVEYTGCELADALATVTSTPADVLGLADRGRIAVDARADLTVLDEEGHVVATVIGGRLVWKS